MKYKNIVQGKFINRPNRFIANIKINDKIETVHVKNTGRCKELLLPNTTVYMNVSDNPNRKTKYDLIAVEKQRENKQPLMVNMDSQVPNDVAEEWLKKGNLFSKTAIIKREVFYNNSRFDFFIQDGNLKAFLEVKGVTLEENGVAMFPDAPTQRGIKHINELISSINEGYKAYILFVIQMKEIKQFMPNYTTHKEFGEALEKAQKLGVKILALDCKVSSNSITADKEIPFKIGNI